MRAVSTFRIAVVGKGMIGAAAARHLAQRVSDVALIGPDEPARRDAWDDVFASHYDEGRIYRILDPDPIWALLARRAIDRYAEIEAQSGIAFHEEAGFLAAGPDAELVERYASAGERLGAPVERLGAAQLAARFPYLDLTGAAAAAYQPYLAGHISPRRLVQAQETAAARFGATIFREPVHALDLAGDGIELRLANGSRVRAEQALIATGGFANVHAVLPQPAAIDPSGRVIVLAEVDQALHRQLRAMPSIVADCCHPLEHIYALPPVRYPNGRWYIKIGTGEFRHPLRDLADFVRWFQSDGATEDRRALHATLLNLVPALRGAPIHTDTCVVTTTPSGYPYIDLIADGRICVAIGGNGAAAKSSDEIGRLAAELLLAGAWPDPDYPRDSFRLRLAATEGAPAGGSVA
jgi:sarcosine oxidase